MADAFGGSDHGCRGGTHSLAVVSGLYVECVSEAADVPQLTRLWDQRLRRDASRFDRLAPEAIERGTLLRGPASEPDIDAAERRLGVRLPPTYRAFLLCSNGAYASSLGSEQQDWWGDTTFKPAPSVAGSIVVRAAGDRSPMRVNRRRGRRRGTARRSFAGLVPAVIPDEARPPVAPPARPAHPLAKPRSATITFREPRLDIQHTRAVSADAKLESPD